MAVRAFGVFSDPVIVGNVIEADLFIVKLSEAFRAAVRLLGFIRHLASEAVCRSPANLR